jgi:hypothetical protein
MRCANGAAFARPRLANYFRKFVAALVTLLMWPAFATTVRADGSPPPPNRAFFVAMRAPVVDPGPRYVSASPVPVDGKPTAITACDGNTYYLSLADGAAVRAAIANGNTVQLQIANLGDDPSVSQPVCLIQASQ